MATRPTLDGVAQLTRQLIALGKLDDGKVLRGAVKAGIQPAYKRAKATIPVGSVPHRLAAAYGKQLVNSGFAQQSLRTISTINAQKNVASALLGVRKSAFYILNFVELGTRYQRAQPFLRPAFYNARSDMEAALREYLQKAVLKAAATK
jgi:HK97 gp10 family phage protein